MPSNPSAVDTANPLAKFLDAATPPVIVTCMIYEPGADTSAPMFVPSFTMGHADGRKALAVASSSPAFVEVLLDGLEPVKGDRYIVITGLPSPLGEWPLIAKDKARLDAGEAFKVYKLPEPVDDKVEGSEIESGLSPDGEPVEIRPLNEAEVHGTLSDDILKTKLRIAVAAKRDEKKFVVTPEVEFSALLNSDLTKIRVGNKDGKCFVPGVLMEGRRVNPAVTALYMMGLDVDSGASMEETMAKLRDMGLFFIAYTTHSHGSTQIEIKKDLFYKWATDNGYETDPSDAGVKIFLTEKAKYTADVIASAEYVETVHETTGIQIIVKTRPIDKFRLVFLLDKPYVIAEQPTSQKDAIVAWGDMILGMGAALGIKVDRAARDCSRLFYLPSRHKDARNARIVVSAGNKLDYTTIKKVSIRDHNNQTDDVFDQAAAVLGGRVRGNATSPQKGLSLTKWAGEKAHGFQISQVFKDYCDDRLKKETAPGKFVAECPFDEDHSNAGDPDDPGCFICDAGSDFETFAFRCSHDSCSGRDRLDMLEKAMVDGWFTDDVLTDPTYDILAEEPEDEDGDETVEAGAATTADIAKALKLANEAKLDMPPDKITTILKMLVKMGQFDRSRILSVLAQKTKIPASQLTALYKSIELKAAPVVDDKPYDPAQLAQELRKRFKSLQKETRPITVPHEDHPVASLRHILKELARANKGDEGAGLDPAHVMFDFGGNRVRIYKDTNGKRVIKELSQETMRNTAMELLYVCKVIDSSTQTEDLLSYEMCQQLIVDPRLPVLPLTQFSPHMVFDRDGNLLTATGYYPSIGRFLNLDGIDLGFIKKHYTDVVWEDVEKAVAALKKAFGDFRWTGYADDDDGAGARMSFAHYIALLITPLIYEILKADGEGNAMLFGIDKPDAASGGTLLGLCANIILAGTKPDQLQWPRGKDADVELEKKLIPVCKRSPVYLIVDNVHGVIGGSLIASLATGSVSLRSPHSADLFDAELRFPAVFIGNGLAASDENVRRFLPIRIDPTEADEDGNKHFEIEEKLSSYLLKNRSEYLGHLCTIVQWWLKQGRPLAAKNVESFEEFVSIMGGILKAAGIPGWLEGLGAFIATSKKSQADEIGILQTLTATFKLDGDFLLEASEPLLFNELEGGSGSYQRYEARFAYLESCVQNGAISRLSLGKKLGYIASKPRKIVYEGETIKVRLTKRESNGKSYWRIVRAT